MGVCYETGSGCQQDINKAKEYYKKAYKLGYVEAKVACDELLESEL